MASVEMRRIRLAKAAEVQKMLSSKRSLGWDGREVDLVAGADFSYDYQEKSIRGALVVFRLPELELVEVSEVVRESRFPYVPGFLAFREGPVFQEAFRRLKNKPDVTLVDGNGIAHPRKMGLASFVGVTLDICTIGCAKTPFFPFVLPGAQRGASTVFRDSGGEKVWFCLRTRSGVKPVFISPGHRIDLSRAKEIILRTSKFRIPEPLREAHRRANRLF